MTNRRVTLGWGPKEDAQENVKSAFRSYETISYPATLILTMHRPESDGAGIPSALPFKREQKVPFEYQVGEMFGFLGSFLEIVKSEEDEYIGLLFVNHTPRDTSLGQPVVECATLPTLVDGVQQWCELVSRSLRVGPGLIAPRVCDWAWLMCESVVGE